MLKFTGTDDRGKPLLGLCLSRRNCEWLLAGKPIRIRTEDIGLAPMTIILMAGETETAIWQDLRRLSCAKGAQVQVTKEPLHPGSETDGGTVQ